MVATGCREQLMHPRDHFAPSGAPVHLVVPKAVALDRKAIREHARKRFSHHRLVDDYLRIFRLTIENPR